MPAPTPFDVIYSPFSAGVLPAFVVDPDEGELISVSFNPTYLPYVVGAAKSLVQPALYRGVADIELQLNRANLLLSMINNPNAYERPFYDDDEQMDDSTLPAAPWYEEVSDWIITLFLAVTFTPGAAIVYKTTIPRLRLAFRTGNIGTIVRVLIDDIEVWTGNTYSATEGLLETVIDVPAAPGIMRSLLPNEHILKVIHAGETGQKLEVVRGDLRPQMTTLLRMDQQCGTLQASYDGGTTWADIVDIGACITAGVNTGIQDALNAGSIAAPSQQRAGGTIPFQQCQTYNITLRANQPWHSPNPVRAGYTVTVSNARGGWSDVNTVIGQWACPNGTGYAFGLCGSALATRPGDPLPSVSHLRLIGYCHGIYMDMYNTGYTVPAGTPNSDFFLQANDDVLSDNAGEIQLTVVICNYSDCIVVGSPPYTNVTETSANHYTAETHTPYPGSSAPYQLQWAVCAPGGNYASGPYCANCVTVNVSNLTANPPSVYTYVEYCDGTPTYFQSPGSIITAMDGKKVKRIEIAHNAPFSMDIVINQ